MTNVYVDRMAPAFSEGKYRFGKHPTLLEESAQAARPREDGADVVVAVTEIGLPWMVQAAKDCASVDVMFSAHTHEYTYDPIVVEETETVVVESGMGEAIGRVDLRVRDGEIQFRHHLYCLTEDGEHTPEPDADAAETVEAVRAPSSRPIRDSSEGLARSTVRWMRSSVGRKNRSTGSPSLRARGTRCSTTHSVHTSAPTSPSRTGSGTGLPSHPATSRSANSTRSSR